MPLNETCYAGTGDRRECLTITEALAIKDRKGSFTGYCIECGARVCAHRPSKYGAAHFQHIEGNEHCSLSAPHR